MFHQHPVDFRLKLVTMLIMCGSISKVGGLGANYLHVDLRIFLCVRHYTKLGNKGIHRKILRYNYYEQHIDVTNYIIYVIIYITSLYDVKFLTQLYQGLAIFAIPDVNVYYAMVLT